MELTAKSRERYRELLYKCERRWPNGMILYLTGWPTAVEYLLSLMEKAQSGSTYAASLAEFRGQLGRCEYPRQTTNGYRKTFILPAIKLDDIRGRNMAALFKRHIGIDYSGAETPTRGLIGLQVFEGGLHGEPTIVSNPAGGGRKWTRKAVAHWLLEQLTEGAPTIVGIDHAFSFPISYLNRYSVRRWDQFLDDFCQHWPTDGDSAYVDFIREKNPARTGGPSEFRLVDRWSSSAKSMFQYDGPGTVGKSTHAGIPLRFFRRHERLKGKAHFWPFDGFGVPQNKSVIAEVYPSIFAVDTRTTRRI